MAGDRLPDVQLQSEAAAPTTLHMLCAGLPAVVFTGDSGDPLPHSPSLGHALRLAPADGAPKGTHTRDRQGWAEYKVPSEWLDRLEPGVVWVLDAQLRIRSRVPLPIDAPRLQMAVEEIQRADASLVAPLLQVPAVLEADLCAAIVRHLRDERGGGEVSQVLIRDETGPRLVVDPAIKRRRECLLEDAVLEAALHERMSSRVLPEIARAFQFAVRRRDPFKLLAYAATEGYFRRHRDNDTPDVAHRRFAVSINLDEGNYEGGAFRFPEFGQRTLSPPTGTALVFSCSLLHEVLPVTRGVRHALTTFLA